MIVWRSKLALIYNFKERFDVIPGVSNHTLGSTVPIVATTLRARIIEKHFILARSIGGPDASFSMDQSEFTNMMRTVREAEEAKGLVDYELTDKQLIGRDFLGSLYVVKDVKKGDIISNDDVRSIRPELGLHPIFLNLILGKHLNMDIKQGTRMSTDLIDNEDENF